MLANGGWDLTLTLLTWTIWRAHTSASKWRMGFNSVFKGLRISREAHILLSLMQIVLLPTNCLEVPAALILRTKVIY